MSSSSLFGDSTLETLVPRKPSHDDAEFDITAMIDLVFMMNIYFLVTFIGAALGEINLPTAQHASPLDASTAVVITVLGGVDGRSVQVFLADGPTGTPLVDPDEQETRIAEYVAEGQAAGKTAVLFKAESRSVLGETGRLMAAASLEGMKMHTAVAEKDVAP